MAKDPKWVKVEEKTTLHDVVTNPNHIIPGVPGACCNSSVSHCKTTNACFFSLELLITYGDNFICHIERERNGCCRSAAFTVGFSWASCFCCWGRFWMEEREREIDFVGGWLALAVFYVVSSVTAFREKFLGGRWSAP